MKAIIGLGNQGENFQKTRHNIGFQIIDLLREKWDFPNFKEKNFGNYSIGEKEGEKIIIIKPTTMMNNSGECVQSFVNYYKLSKKQLLVVYDDISMEIAKIRFRERGTSGGHNGVKSIIEKIKSEEFARIKIGVGNNQNINLKSWVIGKFSEEEQKKINDKFNEIIGKINQWIR